MGRGVNLGLGGLGFLLTNGTAFFTLKNSFHSPDSLKNPNLHLAGGGKAQTKKEETLKLDFAKKKENDLPIVSAKQDTLPEVKLELESEGSELDVPKDLFDYSTQNTLSKVKDVFLEIEKENRVNQQKEKIQEFEGLAKSIKKAIPQVFDHLISEISQTFSTKSRETGEDGRANFGSSEAQVPAEMSPSPSSSEGSDNTQEQQLKGTEGGGKNEESETEVEEMGNCVINSSAMGEILRTRGIEPKYYSISCTKEKNEENDIFETRWGGAFPKALFTKELNESTRLNITAKMNGDAVVQSEEEDYQFVFEFLSNQFKSPNHIIFGDFKYEGGLSNSNNTGAIVTLTDSENEKEIYLLTNLDENAE